MDKKQLRDRIRNDRLLALIVDAQVAAGQIRDGMVVGVSGFTPSGYPKAVPLQVAQRAKEGERFKVTLYSGASTGPEVDGAWAEAGILERRLPYITDSTARSSINQGGIRYVDMHLSHAAQYINYGFLPKVDVAIVEALAITEDGHLIPTSGVGNTPSLVKSADRVIVEVNLRKPLEMEGMADIYLPANPPHRTPIPITSAGDRIGTPHITCGLDKIAAIVLTDLQDTVRPLAEIQDAERRISRHILRFLRGEVQAGRLTRELLPLQSGVGSVANAVLYGLCDSEFKNLTCYTEVLQDSMLELLLRGKAVLASTSSLSPSPQGLARFEAEIAFFKDRIILRPQEISNHPEVIRRLGVISMNTALEADIYGNVNSTHILGSSMVNGIGGSGDFARNGAITIFSTPSTAKNGAISAIVPMVSHLDHTEHDVMVLVTEQGYADLRGLSPRERAVRIIENCAHPDYREGLRAYFDRACETTAGQTPHLLEEALGWHTRYQRTGSMKEFHDER